MTNMEASFRVRLREYIRAQALPPDKLSHQARLYRLTVEIGRGEGCPYDDEVVYAAAWLHDLGVFVGHRPEDLKALAAWDHVAYVVAKAPELLRDMGFPEARIEAVLEVIRTHAPKDTPTSYEGVLLRDADMLEQLGAVGILRTASKVGRDTRFLLFSDALRVLQANWEKLPGLLVLETSKKLAAARVETLRSFLASAEAETGEIPW